MDPIGVTGLGIAAAGFAIQLFEAGLAAYKVFTDAKSLGADSGMLQSKLMIQYVRLLEWGDEAGLTKGETGIDPRLRTQTLLFEAVVSALSNIRGILTDVESLQKRYGLRIEKRLVEPEVLSVDGPNQQEVVSLAGFPEPHFLARTAISDAIKKREEEAKRTQKALGTLKKLRWAIYDKTKFRDLMEELESMNNGLCSLIPPEHIARALLGHLLRTDDRSTLACVQNAAQDHYPSLHTAALFKDFYLGLSDLDNAPSMSLPDSSNIQFHQRPPENAVRTVAVYQPAGSDSATSVLVEWKYFLPKWRDALERTMLNRMNAVARLLNHVPKPEGFRTLHCFGYMEDAAGIHRRFGLVYRLPNPNTSSKSLYNLLSDEVTDSYQVPFLGDRFRLALVLVTALYELHLTNWLHKSIRSDNILFFMRKGVDVSSLINSPYLVGFDYSRPESATEASEQPSDIAFDLYRHPDYRSGSTTYRREFDIYSIGVVLVEIGLWTKIKSFYQYGDTPHRFKQILLEECLGELGSSMGTIYRDAVKVCLSGALVGEAVNDSSSASEIEEMKYKLMDAFLAKVVKELSRCRA